MKKTNDVSSSVEERPVDSVTISEVTVAKSPTTHLTVFKKLEVSCV